MTSMEGTTLLPRLGQDRLTGIGARLARLKSEGPASEEREEATLIPTVPL